MVRILAIDPGSEESAYVIWDTIAQKLEQKGKLSNEQILELISIVYYNKVVIEMIACYGMPVGQEVFLTVEWIGRFEQLVIDINKSNDLIIKVFRKEVKLHFCNSMKAKDANIRQALIDRFGKPGTKKSQGKLYGVSADIWSALALAVYYADMKML